MKNIMDKIDCYITIRSAEEIFNLSQSLRQMYDNYLVEYNRNNSKALWLYWFARNVIHDHWPDAEDIISSDLIIGSDYQSYLNVLKQFSILGKSSYNDDDFIVNNDGVIVGLHEQTVLCKSAADKSEKMTIQKVEEIADNIAAEMAMYKMSRTIEP